MMRTWVSWMAFSRSRSLSNDGVPLLGLAASMLTRLALGMALGLFVLCLIVNSVASSFGVSTSALAYPVIVIDQPEWDFGEVRPDQTLHAQFAIRNAGGRRLILRKSNNGCDCVSTKEVEIIVEPGKSRTIVAELDANQLIGPVKIELTYRTNDPQQPLIRFYCVADRKLASAQERPVAD